MLIYYCLKCDHLANNGSIWDPKSSKINIEMKSDKCLKLLFSRTTMVHFGIFLCKYDHIFISRISSGTQCTFFRYFIIIYNKKYHYDIIRHMNIKFCELAYLATSFIFILMYIVGYSNLFFICIIFLIC